MVTTMTSKAAGKDVSRPLGAAPSEPLFLPLSHVPVGGSLG